MIEKISVTNFKSHAHTEIELGRVTAIVGPNGCGKTSILQAAHLLNLLCKHSRKEVFQGNLSPFNLVRRKCDEFAISVRINIPAGSCDFSFHCGLEANAQRYFDQGGWGMEVKRLVDSREEVERALDSEQTIHDISPPLVWSQVEQFFYLKVSLSKLASPSYTEEIPPKITYDGGQLASTLAYFMTYDRETLLRIETDLQSIVPIVRQVRARPSKIKLQERKFISVGNTQVPYDEEREVVGHELIFDTINAEEISAGAMSEGTLLALCLLTILHSEDPPRLILIDDVEQGLHPLAQRALMQVLKKFAADHDRQIILTSHSPYIVDEFEAKDVWVMSTDKEGVSHSKRLSDHPDAERALQILTTGEFLGAEGEDWVVPDNTPIEEAHA